MAKKTSKSNKLSSSSSASPASSNTIEKIRTSERLRQKRLNLAINPKKNPKSTNFKIDAKIPKKPASAFFFFLEDFRKDYIEQNPDVKSMRDIGKACGEKWKTMMYEEKVKYYDIATEKRAEFDQAMADYIKKKESAEYEETDDDSDFA